MNTYRELGFTYIPPNNESEQIAREIHEQSVGIHHLLGALTARDIEKCSPKVDHRGSREQGVSINVGFQMGDRQRLGFMAGKYPNSSVAFADVGFLRDPAPEELTRPHIPRTIKQLCQEVTLFGTTALTLFGLKQPRPFGIDNMISDSGGLPPTAGIAFTRFNRSSRYEKGPDSTPRAIMNISSHDHQWRLGFYDRNRSTVFTQAPGGIIITEGRSRRTKNPSPVGTVRTADTGYLFEIATTVPGDFDQRFGLDQPGFIQQ